MYIWACILEYSGMLFVEVHIFSETFKHANTKILSVPELQLMVLALISNCLWDRQQAMSIKSSNISVKNIDVIEY